jgi:hypothetical protein
LPSTRSARLHVYTLLITKRSMATSFTPTGINNV